MRADQRVLTAVAPAELGQHALDAARAAVDLTAMQRGLLVGPLQQAEETTAADGTRYVVFTWLVKARPQRRTVWHRDPAKVRRYES